MAIDFSAASTDGAVTTAYTTHNDAGVTYMAWTYRTGDGGGALGRIFDKRTGAAAEAELFYNDTNAIPDEYRYIRARATTSSVFGATEPALNTWVCVHVSYDASATTNTATITYDGVNQTLNTETFGGGAVTTNTAAYVIGNRTSTANRAWGGYLGEFAIWNRILTAAEKTQLALGLSPLFFMSGLVEYVPLIREEELSYRNAAPTASGTLAVAPHPPEIIYPSRGMVPVRFTAAPGGAGGWGWMIGGKRRYRLVT